MTTQAFRNPKFTAIDSDGTVLNGGQLYVFESGSTTNAKTTYSDPDLSTTNTHPIILDSKGQADVYFSGTARIRLFDADDNLIFDEDDQAVVGDINSEWVNSQTATFVSSTSFTISGDHTDEYHVGRRIQAVDSSTLYGFITASTFSDPNTTITVDLDSGSLTASLSEVSVGVLAADNTSVPYIDNLKISGNTISSVDTNGDINLTPNGTGQVKANEFLYLHSCSQSTSTDDYTRLCRIVFDAQAEYCNVVLRVLDGIESTADNDACELVICARQEAALNSDPAVTLRVRNLDGAESISHTSFAAYYSTVSASESIIDIYVTSASGDLDAFFQALTINNNGAELTFYDSDGTDTEANITGGTFDATSQAARGEVVYDESVTIDTGDFSSGSGRVVATRGNGGFYVKLTNVDATHSSMTQPTSGSGIVTSEYAPPGTKYNCTFGGGGSVATHTLGVQSDGSVRALHDSARITIAGHVEWFVSD